MPKAAEGVPRPLWGKAVRAGSSSSAARRKKQKRKAAVLPGLLGRKNEKQERGSRPQTAIGLGAHRRCLHEPTHPPFQQQEQQRFSAVRANRRTQAVYGAPQILTVVRPVEPAPPRKPANRQVGGRNGRRTRRRPASAQPVLPIGTTRQLVEQLVPPRGAVYPFEWIEGRDAAKMDMRLSFMAAAVRQELEEMQASLCHAADTRTEWGALLVDGAQADVSGMGLASPEAHVGQLEDLLQELAAARDRLRQVRKASLTPEEKAAAAEAAAAVEAAAAAEEAERRALEREAQAAEEAARQAMDDAATRVQSAARGLRDRRVAAERKAVRQQETSAARRIQSVRRGQQGRAEARNLREERARKLEEERVAQEAEESRLRAEAEEARRLEAQRLEEQRQAQMAALLLAEKQRQAEEAEQQRLREEAAVKAAKEAEERRQAELAAALAKKKQEDEVAAERERLRVEEEQRAVAAEAARLAKEQATRLAEEEAARKLKQQQAEEEARLAKERLEADRKAKERERQLKELEEAYTPSKLAGLSDAPELGTPSPRSAADASYSSFSSEMENAMQVRDFNPLRGADQLHFFVRPANRIWFCMDAGHDI